MIRLLLLALPLLFATPLPPTQASTSFAGRWAESIATCANTRAQGGEIPIMITRWSIETTAAFCRVRAAARTTDRTWRLRAHCNDSAGASGEPRRPVTVTLRIKGDRLAIEKDSGVRLLVRCSP